MPEEHFDDNTSGRTAQEVLKATPGTPEHAVVMKTQLRAGLMDLKKRLIQLKMQAVKNRFIEGEKAVHKAVDLIDSKEMLEKQLRAEGYEGALETA
ncbi:unnamed protein product [marine sediment metagenome]|uniref:Uncharacterized protein n=1 Tax=marine sediment metagenome TaxID=412755 RepID=X1M7J7_9ZZZZ